MPLIGSDYLLRLAALSLSFVGFGSIVVTLRRATGGDLSDLHTLLVRLFIEGGFAVTLLSLLPPVLSYTSLPHDTIWRASSAVAGVGIATYLVAAARRRRRVLRATFPLKTVLNFLLSVGATITLLLNASGLAGAPRAALFILPITTFFVVGILLFLLNLEVFIQASSSE